MKLTEKALLAATPDVNFDVFASFEVDGVGKYYWSGDGPSEDEIAKRREALDKRFVLLYGDYTYEDYSGDAYVLGYDKQEKKFFEVHGSHCSCYGLEDQWDVEYCSLEELEQLIARRFKEREKYSYCSRAANCSTEFENWLKKAMEEHSDEN
jgi:hypothetical protein